MELTTGERPLVLPHHDRVEPAVRPGRRLEQPSGLGSQLIFRCLPNALPQKAMNAYLDQCAPADPRVPLIDDMRAIIRRAYYVTTADTDD